MNLNEAVRLLKKIRQDMASTARELRLEAAWAPDLAAMDLAIGALERDAHRASTSSSNE